MAVTSPNLEVKNSLEIVINSVRDSFLNFSMQESPYFLYFYIRKSFSRASQATPQSPPQCLSIFTQHQADPEMIALKAKVTCLEEKNFALTNQYDLKVKLHKSWSEVQKKDKIVEQMKVIKDNLARELEVTEKNWKELNRFLKAKGKDLHELNKENFKITEKYDKAQADYKNPTANLNQEKKSEAGKVKKAERSSWMVSLRNQKNFLVLSVLSKLIPWSS